MDESRRSIVLVGFQDQGNLGLGYLAAVLMEHGYVVHIIDVKQGPDNILRCIRRNRPLLIGFSIIFQYYLSKFARLASFLASRGVDCHLTVGGHYPSLCCEQTFEQIPELDSVVLFEGEYTLLDLVEHLHDGRDWRRIPGIAYRGDDEVVRQSLRPLVRNLDQLPFPHRPAISSEILGHRFQPILATRGCPRNCAFCSIREFYGRAQGKRVRRRSPGNVVREMAELFHEQKVRIFLFQDDDFPLIGKAGRRWTAGFLEELERQKLLGQVIWKISCRVDEVDRQLFATMRDAGLYLVYFGIESGTEAGLRRLGKQVTVADNLRAIRIIKELNLMFGYGFMLFDPGSSFPDVKANVRFLRKIIGDGSAAALFCKMLPYAGTPIAGQLARAGRLRGSIAQPDYNFLDPVLDEYYERLREALSSWIHGRDAVSHYLNLAWHEVAVIKRLFPKLAGVDDYERFLAACTKDSNERVFGVVENSANSFESDGIFPVSANDLRSEAAEIVETMLERRDSFVYQNQGRMLDSLAVSAAA